MALNCFDILPNLKERFEKNLKDGMTDKEQRELGKKISLDYHKELHDELNKLKKSIGVKQSEYTAWDKSAEVEKIKSEYQIKIANALENKGGVSGIPESKESAKAQGGLPQIKEEGQGAGEEEGIRLSHADTKEIYERHRLPGRLETPTKKDTELEAAADRLVESGYDFDKEADRVMKGEKKSFTDEEQVAFAKMVGALEAKQEGLDINSPEFNKLQEKIEKYSRASDIVGTLEARGFRARQLFQGKDETKADYVMREKEAAQVDTLTEQQKEKVQKEYEDIAEAKRKFDEYVAAKEAELSAKQAQAGFEKQKGASKKVKKTHEDHVEYRKKVIESMKEKLKQARGETSATILPYAKELFAIAPDVAKLVKDLVEEGVTKLEDVVKNIHTQLKPLITDIKEKDVHDIIAGVYNEKKKPRSELARQVFELKRESKYVNKLFELLQGEEPKSEKARIERNKNIAELKKHIKNISEFERDVERQKTEKAELVAKEKAATEKGLTKAEKDIDKAEEKETRERESAEEKERKRLYREAEAERKMFEREFEKEKNAEARASLKLKAEEAKRIERELSFRTPEERALASIKTRMANEIKELEYKLKTGDFDAESRPKKQLKLDEEGLKLKDRLIKLKQQREIRLLQTEYANRSKYQKFGDTALEVLNVPRTIMASMDFSAPLRQGLTASISHPRTAGKAGIEMMRQAVSQKRFDRWFHDLKESKNYELMQEAELYVSDPHDPRLSAKEEAFMNNLAEKIPFIGKLIKGSERAYVGYLNKMRTDLFNRFAERYMEQGKTIENSPELYKRMADYINNSTGRGKLLKLGKFDLEAAAPILNTTLFSPRLIASRLNLLNPFYYAKLPGSVRIMAVKDLLKFVGLGTTILALAKLNGADVEDDPRSSDFGKIRSGDTRWDIWGGFQQYIRLIAQMATGEKKSTTTDTIKELDGNQAFGETRGDVLGRFGRGKLAPVPSMVLDFASGRTTTGQETTIGSEAESHLLPLLYSDIKQAMQDKGISSLFTVGIPASLGVGVQTYKPNQPSTKQQKHSRPQNKKPQHANH